MGWHHGVDPRDPLVIEGIAEDERADRPGDPETPSFCDHMNGQIVVEMRVVANGGRRIGLIPVEYPEELEIRGQLVWLYAKARCSPRAQLVLGLGGDVQGHGHTVAKAALNAASMSRVGLFSSVSSITDVARSAAKHF